MSLPHYAIGLILTALGVHLGLHPGKLGRIGFGVPGGAEPKEIPPLPRWVGLLVATELFCFGVAALAWDVVVHPEFFVAVGVLLFLVTWILVSIVAGFSARQQSGFTAKTASRVRGYRIAAFVYGAIGITLLLLFLSPLIRQH